MNLQQSQFDFAVPCSALERWGNRIAGLCWFGETGIGWCGPHHCWKYFLFVHYDLDWPIEAVNG